MFAFDRQRFLASFPSATGVALNPQRQQGLTFLLDRFERDAGFTMLQELAYVLATIHWETGRTFTPVKEARASETRNPALYALQQRYWPSGYYGRGYVQLTWHYNYRNASKKLTGEVFEIDGASVTMTPTTLIEHPDYLLNPAVSYKVASVGMREGWFTGKKLSTYIKAGAPPNYVEARKIINGLDRAEQIAAIARAYDALLAATRTALPPVAAIADASVAVVGAVGGAASLGVGRSAPPSRALPRAQSVGRSAPPPATVTPIAPPPPAIPAAPTPSARKTAKKATRPTAKKAVKKVAKKAVKKVAKKAVKKAAKKVVKKAVKKTATKPTRKSTKKR